MIEKLKNKKGFTLIELIIVIMIIAVLATIALLSVKNYTDQTKIAVDTANIKSLNSATSLYRIKNPSSDPFISSSMTDEGLIQLLKNAGLIDGEIKPQQKDAYFSWSYDNQTWMVQFGHVTSGGTTGWWSTLITGYSGTNTNIIIPNEVNGIVIKAIYQDAFKNLGLESVTFASDSSITRIHARAFLNNNLTEVDIPDTVTSIDTAAFQSNDLTSIVLPASLLKIETKAFYDNNITSVTIGANVTLADKVFQNNNSFNTAYAAGGAGTYHYIAGTWVKQ